MFIKLKKLRNINNYTSQYMADSLNISKSFYSQIENGKRNLSYDMAIKISSIFKLSPDHLFYEETKELLNK